MLMKTAIGVKIGYGKAFFSKKRYRRAFQRWILAGSPRTAVQFFHAILQKNMALPTPDLLASGRSPGSCL